MSISLRDAGYDHGSPPQLSVRAHFVYTLVENLGLCVVLTDDLRAFLDATCWAQVVLGALGMLGAAVAAAVCLLRGHRTSVSTQLACLALFDFLFLASSLTVAAFGLARAWRSVAVKVCLSLRHLTLWGATYATLDICGERLLSVTRPFLAERLFTVTFTLRRAALNLLLGVAFTVPYVLDLINRYSVTPVCTDTRQLTLFGLIYTLYIALLLLYLLPFTAIIVFNAVFACTLWRLRRRSARQGVHRPSTRELTALVLALIVWYAVCMLAPSLLFLLRLARAEPFEPALDVRLAAVADTLVVASASANFFFYFLLWSPFRVALITCLCRPTAASSCLPLASASQTPGHPPQLTAMRSTSPVVSLTDGSA